MNPGRLLACSAAAAMICLLAACGGGSDDGVTTPQTPPVSVPSGSDKFLLFPNPQHESQFPTLKPIDSMEYAQAYYAAIDPNRERDTLQKWKAVNGFGTGGDEVTVVFGDKRDLGYGRRMTARRNPTTGAIAFLVENYQVDPGGAYGYSSVSLEAAVREDTRWRILVNAIEYSPEPGGTVAFAKFFNFNAVTGERELRIDLDGRGPKFMPGPCLTCHGGRGDGLIPDGPGKFVFPVVQNSKSLARGDTQARLAPLEVEHFDFSPLAGYTRSDQEAKLKTMNMFVLCSYPLAAGAPAGVPNSFCVRRPANGSEWQGTAAELLIEAYGGNTLPRPDYSDTFIPPDWRGVNQSLYTDVVVPSCRACHILRGTRAQSDIDFTTLAKFEGYAVFPGVQYPKNAGFDDRIKVHVIDRGDMPLAKFVYDSFWNSSSPPTLADFLQGKMFTVRDAGGAVLQPTRPIADPGPDRVIGPGPTQLSAAASRFATAFTWSVASRPNGPEPILTNPNSAQPVFNASAEGTYTLRLIASNGATQSAPATLTLRVQVAPPPDKVVFNDVKTVLESTTCASGGCHLPRNPPDDSLLGPPVFFAETAGPRTDLTAFYAEIRSRINFTDIVASPLLRKPSGRHHSGGQPGNFDSTLLPGEPGRADYDKFLNWILADAPFN